MRQSISVRKGRILEEALTLHCEMERALLERQKVRLRRRRPRALGKDPERDLQAEGFKYACRASHDFGLTPFFFMSSPAWFIILTASLLFLRSTKTAPERLTVARLVSHDNALPCPSDRTELAQQRRPFELALCHYGRSLGEYATEVEDVQHAVSTQSHSLVSISHICRLTPSSLPLVISDEYRTLRLAVLGGQERSQMLFSFHIQLDPDEWGAYVVE